MAMESGKLLFGVQLLIMYMCLDCQGAVCSGLWSTQPCICNRGFEQSQGRSTQPWICNWGFDVISGTQRVFGDAIVSCVSIIQLKSGCKMGGHRVSIRYTPCHCQFRRIILKGSDISALVKPSVSWRHSISLSASHDISEGSDPCACFVERQLSSVAYTNYSLGWKHWRLWCNADYAEAIISRNSISLSPQYLLSATYCV